jgi:hypothetical protein
MASYPSAAKVFTTKNTGDAVQAAHVNDLQDEVNAIEAALLGTLAHAVTIGGLLTVSGFGDHAITGSGTGGHALFLRNLSAGTANFAALYLGNNGSDVAGQLFHTSTNYTTGTYDVQEALHLVAARAGGLSIVTTDAAGDIRLYTNSLLRTQITDAGLLEHNKAFGLSSILTPAQITANQNDYAPTDFATSVFLRISSDAARDITGLAGGAQGRIVALSNQGSFTITLKHNSGSSTAGNRFLCPGAGDFALTTQKTCLLYYDSVAAGWSVIG